MALEMKMPDLATTGSDVKIVRWVVEVGQPVKRGDILLEVETDKAAIEVESVHGGVLRSILAEAGAEVAAGQVIAVIGEPSGTASATPAAGAAPAPRGMFARNRESAARAAEPKAAASDSIPLSATRQTVARRMQESKQTVPHFYLEASFNAEPMIARRAGAKDKLLWDAFFVYAAGRALKRFGQVACRFAGDRLDPFSDEAIGVAVDIEGELFVLAARCDGSPEEISRQIAAEVERIRAGDADARRLKPCALTITNLGSTRVERFYAIVNPPEAVILAVGKIAPEPVVLDGKLAVASRGSITLSVDHRVVNGKYAAEFLTAVVDELESL